VCRSRAAKFVDEQQLQGKLEEISYYCIPNEPTIELIEDGVKIAKEKRCDLVIGFGGGSAIDAAKVRVVNVEECELLTCL
jgi:alcohol dehydrogenase class IV